MKISANKILVKSTVWNYPELCFGGKVNISDAALVALTVELLIDDRHSVTIEVIGHEANSLLNKIGSLAGPGFVRQFSEIEF